mmetsp:Transcript_12237/g.31311  ORF Transcript_12237/g.31311 Transcript_12237/m.31311 type:complete len:227 (+) Transcript_12237:243-923(+)
MRRPRAFSWRPTRGMSSGRWRCSASKCRCSSTRQRPRVAPPQRPAQPSQRTARQRPTPAPAPPRPSSRGAACWAAWRGRRSASCAPRSRWRSGRSAWASALPPSWAIASSRRQSSGRSPAPRRRSPAAARSWSRPLRLPPLWPSSARSTARRRLTGRSARGRRPPPARTASSSSCLSTSTRRSTPTRHPFAAARSAHRSCWSFWASRWCPGAATCASATHTRWRTA